jgi:inorganic pyrophosphatase
MRLTKLPAFDPETGHLNVITETPKGNRNNYKYDEKLRLFRLHSLLPAGSVFPYDFGFIPSTRGEDGDPLDVLVLMELPAPGGILVPARLVGVIEARQTEGGKAARNDRLIAVSAEEFSHRKADSLDDLGDETVSELERFFVHYNRMRGREFKPVGRHGPGRARKLVEAGESLFREHPGGEKRPNKSRTAR